MRGAPDAFSALTIREGKPMKLWHFAVLVAVVTVLLYAQNHVPFYTKLTS